MQLWCREWLRVVRGASAMNRLDLQKISEVRLADAEALLNCGRYEADPIALGRVALSCEAKPRQLQRRSPRNSSIRRAIARPRCLAYSACIPANDSSTLSVKSVSQR